MMQKLVVHQLTNDIFSIIIYQRRSSVVVLEQQPAFLFKERQLFQIISEAAVRRGSYFSCSEKFEKIPENHMWPSVFNSKNYITLGNFLKIFQNSYSNISGWLLLQIVNCPKELLFFYFFRNISLLFLHFLFHIRIFNINV